MAKVIECSIRNSESVKAKTLREQRREQETRLLHAENEQKLCIVCCTEEKTVLFAPCHHLCACVRCGESLVDCPICRTKITSRTPVSEAVCLDH